MAKRKPSVYRTEMIAAERVILERALKACSYNRTHTAAQLGISRRTLLYRIEKLGLQARPA